MRCWRCLGLFPVAFAFFVSLHRWRLFPDTYNGLANYEKALGNMAYILFFWIALIAILTASALLRRLLKALKRSKSPRESVHLLSGFVCGYALLLMVDWFFKLIPVIMLIPRQVRGQNTSLGLFMEKLGESFARQDVLAAGNLMVVGVLAAICLSLALGWRFRSPHRSELIANSAAATILILGGIFLLRLTFTEIQAAIDLARESGEALPIWSQLVFVSAGVALMAIAWRIFQRGIKTHENGRFLLLVLAGISLAVGGYILMAELPAALAAADDDLLQGFWVTVMYALGYGAGAIVNRPAAGLSPISTDPLSRILPYGVLHSLYHSICRDFNRLPSHFWRRENRASKSHALDCGYRAPTLDP